MKRFPWHDSRDPVASESSRERTGAAAIHSLADGVGCLEQAGDPMGEEATDERAWRSSRDDPSVLEDFAEFLSPVAVEDSPGEPDRDFEQNLRRKLWRLHVALHLRPGRTH